MPKSSSTCFCDADKLAETRNKLQKLGSNSTYDRACLNLSEEETVRRVRAGEKHIIRLNYTSVIEAKPEPDLVFGTSVQHTHAGLPTDPVLLKTDLFPTYHLASVVDDHEMEITHVLRGEEWLPTLPLHLDLYSVLGLTPPQFGHLPLLLNPDGSKMSKRKGDVRVQDYMEKGWEPEAVVNWLALAGWNVHQQLDSVHKHESADALNLPKDVLTPAQLVEA
ncbi:Glutamate--tRNA ligase mitochondrial, partial [Ceratobasidium sp. 392]